MCVDKRTHQTGLSWIYNQRTLTHSKDVHDGYDECWKEGSGRLLGHHDGPLVHFTECLNYLRVGLTHRRLRDTGQEGPGGLEHL